MFWFRRTRLAGSYRDFRAASRLLLRLQGAELGGPGYWDTDGKRIYFTRTEWESDIYVAEVKRAR